MKASFIAISEAARQRLDQHMAVDLRSLAFFRIVLGLTLLVDLVIRLSDVQSLYSGEGVLSVEALSQLPHLPWEWWLSINILSDSVAWQVVCFGAGVLGAVLLVIGWQSRWVTPFMLIILHSIQARNPWVNYAADKLLFLLLLWGCFLPLDRYWAFSKSSSIVSKKFPDLLSCWGGWGLRLLPCVMYWFSVLRKSGNTWMDGSALRYVLEIDQFALPLGIWLKTFPEFFLQCLSWSALGIELIAPLLLLATSARCRWIGLGALIIFQCSLWLTLDLGIFPWVSTLALLPHIPGSVWRLRMRGISEPSFRSETLNSSSMNRLVGWLLAWMLIWNVLMTWNYPDSLKAQMPKWVANGISLTRMDQYWGMFSPDPMTLDGWYVLVADLEGGKQVDLLDPDRLDVWAKPKNVLEIFPGDRWKEFMMRIFDYPTQAKLWAGVIKHFELRRMAGNPGAAEVQSVTVYYMLEKTLEDGTAPVEKEQLWPVEKDEF